MWDGPDLSALGAVAVYAVVWGFLFAECGLLLGFLLPGDTILFAGGLVAATPGSGVDIRLLVLGAFVAAVLGNEVGYATGRRFGRDWVERRPHGRAREQLARAEVFYERYGWFAVVAARWIPWVRTFVPIIAGTAVMPRRSFVTANVAGALPWAVGLPLLGYYAYEVPGLRTLAYVVAAVAITASVVAGVVAAARSRRSRAARSAAAQAPDEDAPDE